MMTRTQVYLPENIHASLLRLAQIENVSLSELIRKGADMVIKTKHATILSPQKQALKMLADYPKDQRITLGDSAVNLIRQQRD